MSDEKMYGELVRKKLVDGDENPIKPKSRVCLIYTGGTIGMVPTDENNLSSPLRPASLDELLGAVPGLGKEEKIELGLVPFHEPVDSSDVSTKHWLAIAAAIEEHYDNFDGFVVLHGTDTMAFSTAALSFLLNNLAKPVVVTGSQLPIKNVRTDAVQNLTSAVYVAGYKATRLPCIPEVVLCFANLILRGNRATKVSSTQWQGFISPNFPPLGTIGEHIVINSKNCLEAPDNERYRFYADKSVADEIKCIIVNPGMRPEHLKRDLQTEGLNGVILMTYGAGNMPTDPEFTKIISEAVDGGDGYDSPRAIINVTQCVEGMVEMGLYEASSGLLEAGASSGLDLTLEGALAKMYWTLQKFKGRNIHTQLQISQRGEQSQNLFDLAFEVKKVELGETKAMDIIQSDAQLVPGTYDREKLLKAIVRIQGVGMKLINPNEEASVRIFINEPDADQETSVYDATFGAEFRKNNISKMGSVLCDVTPTARNVVTVGTPVSVTLVGINAKVWCRSIHLAFYTDAR